MSEEVNYMMTGMQPRRAPGKPTDMYAFVRPSEDTSVQVVLQRRYLTELGLEGLTRESREADCSIEGPR